MARKAQVTITEDHLKLLGHMYVDWDDCEYGAPAINPKRPYGNSDVPGDIAEILGWSYDDEDEDAYDEIAERAHTIHHEMQEVLQIVVRLAGGSKKLLGEWNNKSDYGVDWVQS